jgi:biopolymer transport protein ExbD
MHVMNLLRGAGYLKVALVGLEGGTEPLPAPAAAAGAHGELAAPPP